MIKLFKFKMGRIQLILTTLVWLLILTIPILFGEFSNGINWTHVFKIWKEYSIVFVIFLLNHFVLLPFLFFKGKRTYYALSISGLVVLLTAILFFSDEMHNKPKDRPMMPPPHSELQHIQPAHIQPSHIQPAHIQPRPIDGGRESVPAYANLFIISILLIGFDTGLVFSMKWMQAEQTKLKIEKENVVNKMAFLQNQISPHFLMNTLNNIHALVDISSEEAKEAIIKLSEMMSYMLYESQTEKISLQKELEFIKSYVDLMKLRFTKDVQIVLDIPNEVPIVNIPPLLTISLIENAFKHGISYEKPSFIYIQYKINEKNLLFKIENSMHAKNDKTKKTGIGIENTYKRLDLIYKNRNLLTINQLPTNIFSVVLKIPI